MARFSIFVLALLLVSAEPVRAQDVTALSWKAWPPVQLGAPDVPFASLTTQVRPPEETHKAVDAKFVALGAGLVAAMGVDTHSTFESLAWCPSCQEDNPYAAPFVNRGPRAAYTAGVLFDVGVMGGAAAMRKSPNPALRKLWWAAPVALIVGHAWAIHHNYDLRRVCRTDPRCR